MAENFFMFSPLGVTTSAGQQQKTVVTETVR